jgi:hypothetical protein
LPCRYQGPGEELDPDNLIAVTDDDDLKASDDGAGCQITAGVKAVLTEP